MFKRLKEDIRTIKERDPAARNSFEIFFMYSGLHAIWWYRIGHFFYKKKMFGTARLISQWGRFWTGIDHGMGVVIGETTEIGDNVTIYQGVTLGGTGKDTGKRHPTIGNNVMIGSGAKVLGPFKVGDNSKIAANAVVLNEVPENSTCVGVPARIVKINNERVCEQLDQVHIPDPVSQELCRLQAKLEKLEKKLKESEEK